MLVMNDRRSRGPVLGEGEMEVLPIYPKSAKFDLTLFVTEEEGGLEFMLEYRTDLFTETTADELVVRLYLLSGTNH